MHKQGPELSVVIPLLDEQDNIGPLYEQISQALGQRSFANAQDPPLADARRPGTTPDRVLGDYEVIFIDDGSTDDSFARLTDLQKADSRVRVIRFRKNFGQTAALSAGFAHARGKVIVAMDADLQNDPADIPKMVARLNEGFDVVSGWRRTRHDAAVTRRLPSRMANWLISTITGVRLHDYGCTLKAYRREVLAETRLYGEMHRFIPALASWSGAKIAEVVVNHRPRTAGVAKYGLGRTWKVLLDLITVNFLGSFSTKPIYVFGGLGLLSGLGALAFGLTVIYQKVYFRTDMSGNPLLVLTAVFIIATIQFILMGLLAELLVRTYHESQNRPTYVIKEILEASHPEEDKT